MTFAKKIDASQPDIVKALRKLGIGVICVNGAFDLALDYLGFHSLVECKTGSKAKHTKSQIDLKEKGFQIVRLNGTLDAIAHGQWMRRMSAKLCELPRPDRQEAM